MRIWIIVLIILSGCGVRVVQFVNDEANFKTFRNYALIGLKGQNISERTDSTDVLSRIERHISREMTRRDYQKSNEPDLVLRYEIIANTQTDNRGNNAFIDPFAFPTMNRTFNESTILLELTDFRTKKLVWQASLDLREHNKITKRKDALKVAITNIFNTYLYRAGKGEQDPSLFIK